MDGRILGSVILIIRVFASGFDFLRYQSIVHGIPGAVPLRQDLQIVSGLGCWLFAAVCYHLLVFARPGGTSRLATWMSSPAGGGCFALATLLVTVPAAISTLIIAFSLPGAPIGSMSVSWIPNILISIICCIWLYNSVVGTTKSPPPVLE